MRNFVEPRVYRLASTEVDMGAIEKYLVDTNQAGFLNDVAHAETEGLSGMEILFSFAAKACYKSLTADKNANISKVRSIQDNLRGTFSMGHGSVFEHAGWTFMITDCSRVFTHELVRHRVGTAFSQTSGRYVRPTDDEGNSVLDIVLDPILNPLRGRIEFAMENLAHAYNIMCDQAGLNGYDDALHAMQDANDLECWDMSQHDIENEARGVVARCQEMAYRKKITSALRRVLPNGQSNEMVFSANVRTIRQLVTVRTARHAEWEIRFIFNKIYEDLKESYPTLFFDAKEEMVDGLLEVSGMKLQPWEKCLKEFTDAEINTEKEKRDAGESPA